MDQMIPHVIAYRSLELLFGMHTFNFNCFFDNFNCIFTQIRCLSRVLKHVFWILKRSLIEAVFGEPTSFWIEE